MYRKVHSCFYRNIKYKAVVPIRALDFEVMGLNSPDWICKFLFVISTWTWGKTNVNSLALLLSNLVHNLKGLMRYLFPGILKTVGRLIHPSVEDLELSQARRPRWIHRDRPLHPLDKTISMKWKHLEKRLGTGRIDSCGDRGEGEIGMELVRANAAFA